jgi:hypothetical protein
MVLWWDNISFEWFHEQAFPFIEATVTGNSHLVMWEQDAVPQLPNDAWLQQDGVPPYFGYIVHVVLDERFLNLDYMRV